MVNDDDERERRAADSAERPPTYSGTLKKLRILIRAAERHSAWIERQCGVNGAQLWLMQELQDTPGMRVGEIATRLSFHQTTTSNLLDSLHKRGYVTKTRDSGDHRVVRLMLSEKGSALLVKAPKPARGLLPEGLNRLDYRSLRRLDAGLQALLDVIGVAEDRYAAEPFPFNLRDGA